jgi:hypothetical protein
MATYIQVQFALLPIRENPVELIPCPLELPSALELLGFNMRPPGPEAVNPRILSAIFHEEELEEDFHKTHCGSYPRFTVALPLPSVVNVPQVITLSVPVAPKPPASWAKR